MWHCLEGLLFSLFPEEHGTRVVSSAPTSICAQDEHCTGVVSSMLFTLCPECFFSPGSQILTDFMMFITGKIFFIIACFLFENLEQFQLLHGHGPRMRSYAGLVIFSVSQLCVTETHNQEMFHSHVTLPFHFCRNHTIWHMSRVWHQPSQVGKTY